MLCKTFNLIRFHLFIFVFIFITLGGGLKKICCNLCQRVFCLCFPLKVLWYLVLYLVFNSFEFIFVYGVRERSNIILLHVAVQFFQYQLLKRLFFIVYSCLLCCRLIGHKCMGLFLAFLSILLIYVSVLVPVSYCFYYCSFVVSSEVREHDSSSSLADISVSFLDIRHNKLNIKCHNH